MLLLQSENVVKNNIHGVQIKCEVMPCKGQWKLEVRDWQFFFFKFSSNEKRPCDYTHACFIIIIIIILFQLLLRWPQFYHTWSSLRPWLLFVALEGSLVLHCASPTCIAQNIVTSKVADVQYITSKKLNTTVKLYR